MTLHSDLFIPRDSDIIARALDSRESAVRLQDDATKRQIDRLIANVPGARLCWQLGTLHIDSPSGGHYQVTRGGCSCLNAQRCGRRACWHVALFELLLELLSTAADTADMEDAALVALAAPLIDMLDAAAGDCDYEADCDELAPPEWRIGTLMAARLAAAQR